MKKPVIRIIKASSKDRENFLPDRIAFLKGQGFQVLFDDCQEDLNWPYTAASLQARIEMINHALTEPQSQIVLWARGGYGASDLLPFLSKGMFLTSPKKHLVGFSDVSAFHCAAYNAAGWPSVHGPMPATTTWGLDGLEDVKCLLRILDGTSSSGYFELSESSQKTLEGIVFGGCLSVLTNLIGTPFMRKDFRNHILLFEDIGENAGRVIRKLNQWHQTNLLDGVSAIVLGCFEQLATNANHQVEHYLSLRREIESRFGVKTFTTKRPYSFGHVSPNFPFVNGSIGLIKDSRFEWSMDHHSKLFLS